jgi:plastocyanin
LLLQFTRNIKAAGRTLGSPPMHRLVSPAVCVLTLALAAGPAAAADPVQLSIKDHHFRPDSITVPAGTRFAIEVTNRDATAEEFESGDFRVEKIVVPGATIRVFVGPLKPGTYKFFGDYHPSLARGTITAAKAR